MTARIVMSRGLAHAMVWSGACAIWLAFVFGVLGLTFAPTALIAFGFVLAVVPGLAMAVGRVEP